MTVADLKDLLYNNDVPDSAVILVRYPGSELERATGWVGWVVDPGHPLEARKPSQNPQKLLVIEP